MFLRKTKSSLTAFRSASCKICGCDAQYFGSVDFSKNCEGLQLPVSGVEVPYFRCSFCGFLFTDLCDNWSSADFAERIYNEDYIQVDPAFASQRPLEESERFARVLAPLKGRVRFLDYGGGNAQFARLMHERGFDAASYDVFHKCDLEPPQGERFDLLHCCEVLEHSGNPQLLVADMARLMTENSAVFMSTQFLPGNIADIGLNWWYIGPRNGHISLFTMESLAMLWNEQGLEFGSFDGVRHLAWRGDPPAFDCLIRGIGTLYQNPKS